MKMTISINTSNDILNLMGEGMTLSVPHNKRFTPALFDGIYIFSDERHRDRVWLDWSFVDKFLLENSLNPKIAKIDREDIKVNGRLFKKGWNSMGLPGMNYDYYRMIQ